MKATTFSAAMQAEREQAEADFLAEMEAVYARLLRRAGRDYVAGFRSSVTAAGNPDWQIPPEGNLLDLAAVAAFATLALGRLHRRVLRRFTNQPRIGISFSVRHPLVRELLAAAGQRTGQALDAAVQPTIRATLQAAFEEGLSVKDTADRIREAVKEAAPAQARMLARTDLNGLANGGSVAMAKLSGVGYKQWLTASDEKVRPTHTEADGQTVPVGQPFIVGGEEAEFPADPNLSDEESCNCRCTVVYLDAEQVAAPEPQPGGNMATVAAVAPPQVRWHSDIAFEGEATGDGRYMMPRAITWRDLPISLMAMTETGPGGHEGAFLAGKIEKIRRDRRFDVNGDPLPEGVVAIRAEGVFDMEGDDGAEVARLVDDEFVRGVSIDPGMVEALIRDPETGETWAPKDAPEEVIERAMFGEMQTAYVRYEIAGATVCPTPAFANARIAVIASGAEPELLSWVKVLPVAVTAAAAGLAPVLPPRDWFDRREGDRPTALTVTADGQVYGHIALWDSCHTGKPGVCFQPPPSPSGYSFFNLGEVECADGSRVSCGQITLDTGHAPLSAGSDGARRHYDDTGVCAADVRATDGKHGIWVAGAVRPGVTAEQARTLMAAKPSGDWRSVRPGGPLELIGVLAVNVPGFPVPRPETRLVASVLHPEGETVALVAAGNLADDGALERRLRVLGARAEGGLDALAELAGV